VKQIYQLSLLCEEALPLVEAIDQTYFGQLGSQVSDFNRLLLKLEENDG